MSKLDLFSGSARIASVMIHSFHRI